MATASTRTCFEVARGLLENWLQSHANTPVRLLGVGVSGFEDCALEPGQIDRALDEISAKYGNEMITHGLALERKKSRK